MKLIIALCAMLVLGGCGSEKSKVLGETASKIQKECNGTFSAKLTVSDGFGGSSLTIECTETKEQREAGMKDSK